MAVKTFYSITYVQQSDKFTDGGKRIGLGRFVVTGVRTPKAVVCVDCMGEDGKVILYVGPHQHAIKRMLKQIKGRYIRWEGKGEHVNGVVKEIKYFPQFYIYDNELVDYVEVIVDKVESV